MKANGINIETKYREIQKIQDSDKKIEIYSKHDFDLSFVFESFEIFVCYFEAFKKITYCVSQNERVRGNQRPYLKMWPSYLRSYFWSNMPPRGLNCIFGRYVRHEAPKWGSKELIFFAKVRSKELKIFNISLRAYELKFEPNLGCRAENSNVWQISLLDMLEVKIWYFCSKWESKELNHAATGDIKNDGRGVKRGSWPPDIPIPPFQVSAQSPGICLLPWVVCVRKSCKSIIRF